MKRQSDLPFYALILWVVVLAIVATVQCSAADILTTHTKTAALPAGIDVDTDHPLIITPLYVLQFDRVKRCPRWIAYRVTPGSIAGRNAISRDWLQRVGSIDLQPLTPDDYRGDQYDVGHLVPLASVRNSPHAYLANWMAAVAPQRPAMNRGPWLKIENRIRDRVHETDAAAYVVVVPLFDSDQQPLPASEQPHQVPAAFAITIDAGGDRKAYIVPQDASRGESIERYRVVESEARRRSGLEW